MSVKTIDTILLNKIFLVSMFSINTTIHTDLVTQLEKENAIKVFPRLQCYTFVKLLPAFDVYIQPKETYRKFYRTIKVQVKKNSDSYTENAFNTHVALRFYYFTPSKSTGNLVSFSSIWQKGVMVIG